MTAVIIFFAGLTATIGGALLRSCSTGVEADLSRFWCGPQSSAMLMQSHAHCAGCAALASGFALMIAAILMASLRRRPAARSHA